MTQKYQVNNIVSEEVCEIMDDLAEARLRKIDYVRERGEGEEDFRFWLCTYDFSLVAANDKRKETTVLNKKKRIRK